MRGRQCRKAGAVVWQWVPTFKGAVPPQGLYSSSRAVTFPFILNGSSSRSFYFCYFVKMDVAVVTHVAVTDVNIDTS